MQTSSNNDDEYDWIKINDNLWIDELCLESFPCQHWVTTDQGKTVEQVDMDGEFIDSLNDDTRNIIKNNTDLAHIFEAKNNYNNSQSSSDGTVDTTVCVGDVSETSQIRIVESVLEDAICEPSGEKHTLLTK